MNNRAGQHAAPMMVGAPSSVREADESIQVCTMCRHDDDETVFFHFGSFIRSLYCCSYATTSSHRFLVHCIIIIQQYLPLA
jgi:hypothetical protein